MTKKRERRGAAAKAATMPVAEAAAPVRAAYGKQILATVSKELTAEFGQAFSARSHYRAIRIRQAFDNREIVSTQSTQLRRSHFIELLPVRGPLVRAFYAEQVELLELEAKSIRVGEYRTELPPLRERLHRAIEHARESAARRVQGGEGGE
jgi:hypothetical protein